MRRDENEKLMGHACEEFFPLVMLLAAGGELDAPEEEHVAKHVAECAACSSALDREKDLLALLAENRKEPDAPLLAGCRASLGDALDREEERGWLGRMAGVVFGWNRTAKWDVNWLAAGTSWSAAVLLTVGFSAGMLGPSLVHHPAAAIAPAGQSGASETADNSSGNADASVNSNAGPNVGADVGMAMRNHSALSAVDLPTADLAGISVMRPEGSGLPQVRLQLQAREPVTLEGNVNDDNVEQVLLTMLRDDARFCSGARLDAVDLLRARTSDPQVRSALCHTARKDRNAAVRLKALEALNGPGVEGQDMVMQTLLDALEGDENPGVRMEAVDTLRDMAAKGQVTSDDRTLAVLRNRMAKDPDTYIRAQSAAAIRELGPRQKF